MTFTVLRIISFIVAIVGTTYLIPEAVALYCGETQLIPYFFVPMVVFWIIAAIFIVVGRKKSTTLSIRSSFVVVALSWISVSIYGALPLYLSGAIPDFTDAIFESVSGFTTTGATILSQIETLPRTINLWRCQMHWLGGMGIVALTVALLPILGVGGFQLIKAETTGPEKGKLTAKITTTAKALWFIYVGMTALQTVLLKLAGMDFIDALCHAFATLGTGGFSTKNASVGAFSSAAADWICTVFMFLAGINFSLYYYAITRKFQEICESTELKAYIFINAAAILLITLIESGTYKNIAESLRYAAFQVTSIISTTGFATTDYTEWKPASQAVIFILFFIGGCSGSTAGGIKVIRWVILAKQLRNELLKTLHPHGIFTIRIDRRPGRKDIVFSVAAFVFIYMLVLAIATFTASLFGLDLLSSFTGALSMIGNIGPAFNALGPSCNYGFLPAATKWMYSFLMIAGRLEFFTLIIFFSPSFWKK